MSGNEEVRLGFLVNSKDSVQIAEFEQFIANGGSLSVRARSGSIVAHTTSLRMVTKSYGTIAYGMVDLSESVRKECGDLATMGLSVVTSALSFLQQYADELKWKNDVGKILLRTTAKGLILDPSFNLHDVFAWCEYQKEGFYVPLHFRNPDNDHMRERFSKIKLSKDVAASMREFLDYMPVRTVVCAANRVFHESLPDGELIIPANRHHSPTMNKLYEVLLLRRRDLPRELRDEQGFIDQWGTFMDRREALYVARHSGQPLDMERNSCDDELYSEGIC